MSTDEVGAARERMQEAQRAADEFRPEVYEEKTKEGRSYARPRFKSIFPDRPGVELLLRWLAGVLGLSHDFPIVRVVREGFRGDGDVVLYREGAPEIRLRPKQISPLTLGEVLNNQMIAEDLGPVPYSVMQINEIWRAFRDVIDESAAETTLEQAHRLIAQAQEAAVKCEGAYTIHGTTAQTYDACEATKPLPADLNAGRPHPVPQYLIDDTSKHLVIRATDLGNTLRRNDNELRKLMTAAGWEEQKLKGWNSTKADRKFQRSAVVWTGPDPAPDPLEN